MYAELVEEILAWPPANLGCHLGALTSHLSYRVNRRLSEEEVNTALVWMVQRGLLERQGDQVRLREPERPELELYESLEHHLVARPMLAALGVNPKGYVFQKTASGGRLGDGPLTRPDFTLATVKSERFERTLDVYSFEAKNRSGAILPSVYEVVAHGRMIHFPYLVCPRSHLEPQKTASIRAACVSEKVGLILFDIKQDGDGGFAIDSVSVEVVAKRRALPATKVQNYLESRLSGKNCALLERLVRGVE